VFSLSSGVLWSTVVSARVLIERRSGPIQGVMAAYAGFLKESIPPASMFLALPIRVTSPPGFSPGREW
jgi:hypothetical protein